MLRSSLSGGSEFPVAHCGDGSVHDEQPKGYFEESQQHHDFDVTNVF